MTLQDIQQKLVRLTSIVDGWSEGRMNAIERDIALEHLRSIYESLSAATPGDIAPATEPAAMPEHDRPSDGIIVTAVEPVEEAAGEPAGEPVETEEHAEVPSQKQSSNLPRNGAKRQITKTPTDRA